MSVYRRTRVLQTLEEMTAMRQRYSADEVLSDTDFFSSFIALAKYTDHYDEVQLGSRLLRRTQTALGKKNVTINNKTLEGILGKKGFSKELMKRLKGTEIVVSDNLGKDMEKVIDEIVNIIINGVK